ncbi:MAG: ribosome small subunit-dependent GTPase A [Actinomycetota bacterium]
MIDDLARLTPDLASLGWDDELGDWATEVMADVEHEPAQIVRGRIAQVSRGYSLVFTGADAVLAASASIRSQAETDPATGDFAVVVDGGSGDAADDGPVLAAIAPRRSALMRRAAGRVPEPQVLAANVDDVFVMHGLDRELNIRRIERQLVVAWQSGAEPVVVLTKADASDDVDDAVASVRAVAPGVEVLAVSTVSGRELDRVTERVAPGRTVAMLGLSGIGKSTLVNALTDGVVQRTGEVRASDGRGRHTTVTRDLIPVPDGGFIIDTPGIREIGLWQAYDGLDRTFPEIAGEVMRCRFADCEHRSEPGCAVQAALADGLIPHRRLEHWRDLLAELALQEQQLEEFARRSESRDRAEAERRRDDERSNTRRRSRSDQRRKRRGGGRR